MPATAQLAPDLVATHTTVAASSIARSLARHHGVDVQQCHLIRRGLNDNYAVHAADGRRYVARLCAIRPRGDFNIAFETSLLAHLHARGVGVAVSVPTAQGEPCALLQLPEGERALVLFHWADGAVPDTTDDFALTGRTLAQIHVAARDHAGPPSRYTLGGRHLVGRTLDYLMVQPDIDTALKDTYRSLVQRLLDELASVEAGLTRVVCHGDTHGFNNHVHVDEATGTRQTRFFDFDDAGPGFLAYDLCVLPWSYLVRKSLKEADDELRERWARYLHGYRAGGGEVTDADLAAIPLFLQLRHLWNAGEGLGRHHHWGTSMFPADWLKKQPERMEAWRKALPVAAGSA